MSFENQYVTYY